jgi:hypothetical protein
MFSNIYTTQGNQMYLESIGSREPRTTDHVAQKPMTFCISTVWRGMSSKAEFPESAVVWDRSKVGS